MSLALLFDLDGTLMDTLDAIVRAMNAACGDTGVSPPFQADELRSMIGMPVQRQLDSLRGLFGPRADTFAERYYEHFTQIVDRGLHLYPGVAETFPTLVGRAITTMSTRRRTQAEHMLRVTNLRPYFHAVVGGEEVDQPKPQPALPLRGAEVLRMSAQDCVAIGDSPVDILAARAAGMKSIAASYGYGDPRAIAEAGPDATIRRFSELPAVLEALEG